MAVKSSGSLSLNSDIVGEFDGTTPHSLSEYYKGAGRVPNASVNANVPTSGEISFSDFYGATNIIELSAVASPTVINGQSTLQEICASDYISAGGLLEIPASWWLWSDNVSTPALCVDIPCTILNRGKIIGKGGRGGSNYGSGQAGGDAIRIESGVSGVTITNYSGAYIAGGGGGGGGSGGGGGAGGGNGGNHYTLGGGASSSPGIGGAVNASGTSGTGAGGNGGGAGGGGGDGYDTGSSNFGNYAGGGGGRILPGVGGAGGGSPTGFGNRGPGGAGGSAGNPGGGSNTGSGGGGGWGAYGGNRASSAGGAGGYSIRNNSGNSYSFSNSGTIYGSR